MATACAGSSSISTTSRTMTFRASRSRQACRSSMNSTKRSARPEAAISKRGSGAAGNGDRRRRPGLFGTRFARSVPLRSSERSAGDSGAEIADGVGDAARRDTDQEHLQASAQRRAVGEERAGGADREQHDRRKPGRKGEAGHSGVWHEVGNERNDPGQHENEEGRQSVTIGLPQARTIFGL